MSDYAEWKDIPGYIGLYQASNEGEIRSLKRVLQSVTDQGQRIHGKILKPGSTIQGRLQVSLSKDGIVVRYQIHRLVYLAFNGDIPEGMYVLHRDGNHLNNFSDNLYIGNQWKNIHDKSEHGRQTQGQDHPSSKLLRDDILAIRQSEKNQMQLSAEYNVTQATISNILNFKTWRHLLPYVTN